jgi:cold shock protein
LQFAGKVKTWKRDRGFGFVRCDDGNDVFVHESVLRVAGLAFLAAGDRVVFDLDRDAGGRSRCTKIGLEAPPPAAA